MLLKNNKLEYFLDKKVANCLFIPREMITFAPENKNIYKYEEFKST